MALSNWLTRSEWNAVYFAGMNSVAENLGEQMRNGIAVLHKSGYKFRGINSTSDGEFEKIVQVCDGNECCLAELMDGTFDRLGRAKELLACADKEFPGVDFVWLKKAVAEIERQEPRHAAK